jgi:hypothetical protein
MIFGYRSQHDITSIDISSRGSDLLGRNGIEKSAIMGKLHPQAIR